MQNGNAFIKGTLILTISGFISRILGFFYRIFLSTTFGEEGIGLFQLVLPLYIVVLSLSSHGIQMALSCLISRSYGRHQEKDIRNYLLLALGYTSFVALLCSLLIYTQADIITSVLFHDLRPAKLLKILSLCILPSSIHSCFSGYFHGKNESKPSAISNLVEQIGKISFAIILFYFMQRKGISPSITLAVYAMLVGELCACIYVLKKQSILRFSQISNVSKTGTPSYAASKTLLSRALPLSANRVSLNLLQSIEAFSIPILLRTYGMTNSQSLCTYGVLFGMALPCIFLPATITNSASLLLMPTISRIQAQKDKNRLIDSIQKSLSVSLLLGLSCTLFFILFGNWIGDILFHSTDAGNYIQILGWLCPFLYSCTTLTSILNGLGQTFPVLCITLFSILVRIASIFFFIPLFGIYAYLTGLLLSQILCFSFLLILLYKKI